MTFKWSFIAHLLGKLYEEKFFKKMKILFLFLFPVLRLTHALCMKYVCKIRRNWPLSKKCLRFSKKAFDVVSQILTFFFKFNIILLYFYIRNK